MNTVNIQPLRVPALSANVVTFLLALPLVTLILGLGTPFGEEFTRDQITHASGSALGFALLLLGVEAAFTWGFCTMHRTKLLIRYEPGGPVREMTVLLSDDDHLTVSLCARTPGVTVMFGPLEVKAETLHAVIRDARR